MRYKLILKESISKELYFYHLGPKGLDKIVSLEYQYRTNKKLFEMNSNKYRDRLCNGWEIYPNRNPDSLTLEEVHDGICEFRHSENGCNQIYIFRYPPFKGLGVNMSKVLTSNKSIYRIDLNKLMSTLNYVDYGHWMSFSGNKKLTRSYYTKVSPKEYFSRYNDNDPLKFSTLNHIGVSPKNYYISSNYFIGLPIPKTIQEVIRYETL